MKVTSKRPAPVQRMVSSAQELLDYAPMLLRIASDEDYQRGLALYDEVLDQLPDDEGGDDTVARDGLLLLERLLSRSLSDYAASRSPSPDLPGGAPAAILATLLEQHGLTQSDVPEIGSQGVVSELVNGKREFTARQLRAVAGRFGISADLLLA
jgi:HTH-type transcriptional regulator/antitoxin HigA